MKKRKQRPDDKKNSLLGENGATKHEKEPYTKDNRRQRHQKISNSAENQTKT